VTAHASRSGPGRLLPKLVRTTAFRLSLVNLVVFTVVAALALGYVAWSANRLLNAQTVETIGAEIGGLAEQYRLGGIRRLVNIVERRGRQPGASLYLVTTAAGERIAGNVGSLPPNALETEGQREVAYGRGGEEDARDHRAIVRVFILPAGFRLLVGRDVDERGRLSAVIGRAFVVSLLVIGVLGCLGGWFVTRRVLSRVDRMTETTDRIMAGDLSGRLPVSGTGDELDRLALKLNAMLDRMGELMSGLTEVSNNIAHDLKTPLTRLRNRADGALRQGSDPDQLRAALEGVIAESDGLIRVFNALLMIARLEAGQSREGMDAFDLAQVARDVAELYEPSAEEVGVRVEIETEPDLHVRGSRELVGQAVANLVDNAIKHGATSASADRPVTVRARRTEESVIVTVADHGPGVPEADRDRVLERFVRLETARSRPGFGLGLSLAAAVARLHGGTLTLNDNHPGLRVELSLPLKPATAA
jgi:signal transduction histidine kinase